MQRRGTQRTPHRAFLKSSQYLKIKMIGIKITKIENYKMYYFFQQIH